MSIILNEINYFWKLGFSEEEVNLYIKRYDGGFSIIIDTDKNIILYGKQIYVSDEDKTHFSQTNFIILETIDRLITKGYHPEDISLRGGQKYDIYINKIDMAIKCLEFEYEYDSEIKKIKEDSSQISHLFNGESKVKLYCLYTSRLKAGLIEHRYAIIKRKNIQKRITLYLGGIFEPEIFAYALRIEKFAEGREATKAALKNIGDFLISNGMVMKYVGKDAEVKIPKGVNRIGNAVFWGSENIVKVSIPNTVIQIGGDTFYDCVNLVELTIPRSVEVIGDNPFANCPKLKLRNESPHFILKDGGLYNKDMTRLIYFSISQETDNISLPEGLVSIGKHSFYNCHKLRHIIIPESVRIIENNPFSNLKNLTIENRSPHFVLRDGALYNKSMTTLFYYEHGTGLKDLVIPDGVTIIGRHSFYNCQTIHKITIPESVKIIGYNPFTNCSNLSLINHSPEYVYDNGALYNKEKTELIYYSIPTPQKHFTIPNTVKKIGRSAFFGCRKLELIELPENLIYIERSAFAKCVNIQEMTIPDSVKVIDDWAFRDCSSLKEVSISKNTKVKAQTFLNCQVNITWR